MRVINEDESNPPMSVAISDRDSKVRNLIQNKTQVIRKDAKSEIQAGVPLNRIKTQYKLCPTVNIESFLQ